MANSAAFLANTAFNRALVVRQVLLAAPPYTPADHEYAALISDLLRPIKGPPQTGPPQLIETVSIAFNQAGATPRIESTYITYLLQCRSLKKVRCKLQYGSMGFWSAVFHILATQHDLSYFDFWLAHMQPLVESIFLSWLPQLSNMRTLCLSGMLSPLPLHRQICALLPSCPNLTTLDLLYIQFNTTDLEQALAATPQITNLVLYVHNQNDGALRGGSHLTHLRLELPSVQLNVSGPFLAALPSCTALQAITILPSIANNAFATLLGVLAALPTIQEFDITATPDQIPGYVRFLQGRPVITKLGLGYSTQGTLATDFVNLLSAPGLTHLTTLDMRNTTIRDGVSVGHQIVALLNRTYALQNIYLGSVQLSFDELATVLTTLAGMPSLEVLQMHGRTICAPMVDPLLQIFRNCPLLRQLSMERCTFNKDILSLLASHFNELHSLRELNIELCRLGKLRDRQAFFQSVGQIPNLCCLDLSGLTLMAADFPCLTTSLELNSHFTDIVYYPGLDPGAIREIHNHPAVVSALLHNRWQTRLNVVRDLILVVLQAVTRQADLTILPRMPPEVWRLIFKIFMSL